MRHLSRVGSFGFIVFYFFLGAFLLPLQAQLVVTNTNDLGEGSLRWAIEQANSVAGESTVSFNIGGDVPHIIQLQSRLPEILSPIILDATTQPGYDASSPAPVIVLDGSDFTGTNANGFVLASPNSGGSTIRGFSIVGFDPGGALLGGTGIIVLSNGNSVTGNYIGLMPDGTPKVNAGFGIIVGGSSNNTIGGTSQGDRNVISVNTFVGIQLEDSDNNLIVNNYIGTSPEGNVARPNGTDGITLLNSSNNVIGGSSAPEKNIISANTGVGIGLFNGSNGNAISGNYIGVDSGGINSLGNGNDGIIVRDSDNNIIGGGNAEERNIISGNERNGITLVDAADNRIDGNFIGLNSSGTAGIGNGRFGVVLQSSPDNLIAGNTISHNGQDTNAAGIDIFGVGSTGNSIIANKIGTNADGSAAIGNQGSGITLRAINTAIGDGTEAGRNIISGNSSYGISLSGGTPNENNIKGNYIGLSADGSTAVANEQGGLLIINGSQNTIGGVNTGEGNVISGNKGSGIVIAGSGATLNSIIGNFIGVNPGGTSAIGNDNYGVFINGSAGNIVGGTGAGQRNIISGNNGIGVGLNNSASTGNAILGNYIGLDANGSFGVGNGAAGVTISNAPGNQIAENVISHNGQSFSASGIEIQGSDATGNQIRANKIGTNADGTLAIGNSGIGLIIGSGNTVVGGSIAADGNIISGSTIDGIFISKSLGGASNITIQNNLIGVGADGETPMGNGRDGIFISGSSNNLIGGDSGAVPAFKNIIAHNGRYGISLEIAGGEVPVSNGILGNSFFSNSARGIALGLASRVPNDADDSDEGPNRLQNFPEIESVEYDDVAHELDITYIIPSAPENSAYPIRVEFFLTDGTLQGKTYLGSDQFEQADYQDFINNGVQKSIELSLLPEINIPEDFKITSTATDADLNTSEFADPAPTGEPVAGVSYVVTNSDDSGEGSLRWAISEANSSAFRDTIRFDIAGSGPHMISIESPFVSFSNPVVIDGTTQPGYDAQSGVPVIVLDGSQAGEGTSGLVFSGPTSGSSIKGLSIVGFQGQTSSPFAGGDAIVLISDENKVLGNYIGIMPDGTVSSNTGDGIDIRSGSNNTIGAAGIENRNIISGNKIGINISDGATGNQIRNNLIGTTNDGESGAANSEDGILITSSSSNFIGGSEVSDINIISGNTRNGITIQGNNAAGNIISGNHIGVDISGSSGLGNGARGVFIFNSPGNTISSNVISHNGQVGPASGVEISGEFAVNNELLSNRIGTNAEGTAEVANIGSGVVLRTLNTNITGNVISGNTSHGVSVSSFQYTAGNTLIEDNFIGVAIDGATALPNQFDGISISNSSGNIVGGSANVISGNGRHGIQIQGESSLANSITGNIIGLDHTGTAKVANAFDGILLSGTGGNFIGGFDESEKNIISGNNRYGIHIQGTSASANNIIGNYIGVDESGLNGVGNGSYGVYLFNAPENQIAENVISHNGQLVSAGGLHLLGNGAEGNIIKANKIGTDATGNAAIGNAGPGILLRTSSTIIGGNSPADRNVIGGNSTHGIFVIASGSVTENNTILNNHIGIGADGQTPVGNGFDGINITGSSTNAIGEASGQTAASPNTIAHNGRNGITLQVFNDVIPVSNSILGNSIFSNNFRGIDLGLSGRTPNDADDSDSGPNKLQNYPEFSAAEYMSNEHRLDMSYIVPSSPANSAYPIRVEFFLTDGSDQGKTYLGFDLFEEADYASFTDDEIQKSIQLSLSAEITVPEGFALTATATDDEMNSSEFGEVVTATTPPSTVILTAPEDGAVNVSVNPTLLWGAAAGAGTYTVQLSASVDFNPLLLDETGLTDTEYAVSGLDFETVYYWRVRATNQAGDGEWSGVSSFTTEEEPLSPPSVVTLISPGDGAENISVNPTLLWDVAAGAGTYTVQLSASADFNPLLLDETGLTDTEYAVSGLDFEIIYYWRVRATNQAGDGEWSGVSSFTTEEEPLSPPSVVTLISPGDGAENVSVNPTLLWDAAAGADNYTVQLSASADFDPVLVDETGLTDTEFTASGLDYETIYYWRVRATNQAGDGEWSNVWSFTTEVDPDIPPSAGNFVVTTTSDEGEGSLRWAIQQANLSATRDSITFNIQGNGPHTIQLLDRLDSFTQPFVLDATEQPGYEEGKPVIIIDGSEINNSGFTFASGSDKSEMRGLSIVGFNASTIVVQSNENMIASNLIGLLPDGTPKANTSTGILIFGSSNQIGGENSIDRNVISGNGSAGIAITSGADGTLVLNNFIGTSVDGLSAVGNQYGINISNSTNNVIGGAVASKRNIISGNQRNGIRINLDATTGNTIEGNYIGLTKNGDAGLGNGESGVELSSPNNTITGNVISHNGQIFVGHGIRIIGGSATNNQIKANRIGTSADGMSAIGNTSSGIWVSAPQNLFGGDNPEDGNVISGNSTFGMFFSRSQTSPDNHTIRHNLIGVAADGITALGNGNDGILIDGSNNIIGGETSTPGDTPAYPNTIAHNGRNGVTITAVFSEIPYSNSLLGNSIYGNSQHGIDLGGNGRTPNDADDSDDGPNKFQNFPVVSNVVETIDGDDLSLEISYTVPSSPTHSAYPIRVEFFLSDGDTQGKKYLGYDIFNETDFENDKTVQLEISSFNSIPGGTALVSTATDNDGNTSHFSDATEFTGPPGIATLISPGNGATGVSVNPTLSWTSVAGTTSYRVQLSVSSDFASAITDESGLSNTELSVSNLDYETEYFWRVQASNTSGDGDWSSIFSFTTKMEMITVTKTEVVGENGGVFTDETSGVELTFPDGALSSDTEITFGIYNVIPEGATISGLLVSLSGPDSEPITFDEPVLIKVKYDPDNLPDGVTEDNLKLLRYSEVNEEWSELDTDVDTIEKTASAFTLGFSGFGAGWIEGTQIPPSIVTLNSPANGAVDVSITPTLSWQTEPQAASYRLQVSLSGDFASTVVDQAEITSTEYEMNGLEYETIYYWRVRATNDAGDGEWSEAWSFTTVEEPSSPPGIVNLTSPEDGATDISVSPQLSWQELQNTDTYTLQVSAASGFTTMVVDQPGIEETTYQVSGLEMNAAYYWRVRAVNEAGNGDWSDVWSFTTGELSPPGALTLSVTDNNPELSWELSASGSVSGYNVYRGPAADMLELLVELNTSVLNYTDSDVPQGGSFYAVTATGPGGSESAFTNAASFFRVDLQAGSQWQLVSHAVSGAQADVSGSLVYGYQRVYRGEQTLEEARGYWIKDEQGAAYTLAGPGSTQLELDLNAGWNLVGGPAGALGVDNIEDPSAILTTAPVYGYNGAVYEQTDELKPGSGYWLYAETAGQVNLTLDLTPALASSGKFLAAAVASNSNATVTTGEKDRLVVSGVGQTTDLAIYGEPLTRDEKYRYLRPPLAPGQSLDVRTDEGFSVMDGHSANVLITADNYPVTLRLENSLQSESTYLLTGEDSAGATRQWPMDPGTEVVLTQAYARLILQRATSGEEMISQTVLEPGYPNPFNPATNIRYRLAGQADVLLEVYDLAGRRIATLVNQSQQPGAYMVPFDGARLASGVYFVRLQAGGYSSIQKLTLIK